MHYSLLILMTIAHHQVVHVQDAIFAAATQSHLPVAFISAIVKRESHFNPHSVSPDGKDIGLMGVRIKTGAGAGYTKRELFNPYLNTSIGTNYLVKMVNKCGGLIKGLGAYNRGPSHCESNHYAKEIWREYMLYKRETS
jgi:soluble lytic murein transglycosylase-like protein